MSLLINAALGLAGLAYAASAVAAEPLQSKPLQVAQNVEKYYVYCIEDETSVEMWDLEQMKVRRGSDVCLLYENTSMSSAQEWMDKNFPTHECFCDN
jgi:hypothetical protein